MTPAGAAFAAAPATDAPDPDAPARAPAPAAPGAGVPDAAAARIDAFVRRSMRDNRTPGLTLGLTDRGRTLRVATYGYANRDARAPVTRDTLFQIGSISKSFTAVALLQERERGRFDPMAPITDALPWFEVRSRFAPITGHSLLTHTSGLPRDRDGVPWSPYQAAGIRELTTGSAPGDLWAYSNIGYQVLGYALETIAGQPYARIVEERIFAPLGMKATAAVIDHDLQRRLAVGYTTLYDDRPERPDHPIVPAALFEYGGGDGSISSTAADMAAYARMLLNRGAGPRGRLLSEESFALLIQKTVKPGDDDAYYGYGLGVRDQDGHTIVSHSGGMVGFSAFLAVDLDAGLGAVAMVNGPGAPGDVARFALSVVRAERARRPLPALPPRTDPLRVANAADYAGAWLAPAGDRRLLLRADRDRLLLEHGGRRIALESAGDDAFFVDHPDFARYLLRFVRAADDRGGAGGDGGPGGEGGAAGGAQDGAPRGPVVEATHGPDWYAGGRYDGPRVFEVPDDWRALPGHYRTPHPWFSNFRIVLRKDRLWLVSPSGGEDPLTPVRGGAFRVGDDERSAERIRFDTVVEGRALHAVLSGTDYYRSPIP
jgi:CubicO group peptidase (beta-lactamase class C family)